MLSIEEKIAGILISNFDRDFASDNKDLGFKTETVNLYTIEYRETLFDDVTKYFSTNQAAVTVSIQPHNIQVFQHI